MARLKFQSRLKISIPEEDLAFFNLSALRFFFRSHLRTPALKTEEFSKKSVVLVKRKNGFTNTIP